MTEINRQRAAPSAAPIVTATAAGNVTIHRFDQHVPFPVNAFIVEDAAGLVVIDSTLTNTASKALRAKVDQLRKPLRAVLLTHAHPDHYAGLDNLVAGLDVPILSVAGVNDVVRRDDAMKDQVIGAMFGAEWPAQRVFPNRTIKDGETLAFGSMRFEVRDLGPAESRHDSMFVLQGPARHAFVGDIAYGYMHAYMADNQNPSWQRILQRLQSELPQDMLLHIGHGAPVTPSFLRWQSTYLDVFENLICRVDWRDAAAAQAAIVKAMQDYLPNDDLLFLMQLSIQPNADRLGVTRHGP
jgi:glyoxylase-like metal-dependent hydrolase (beta-lactamase superfamily II)